MQVSQKWRCHSCDARVTHHHSLQGLCIPTVTQATDGNYAPHGEEAADGDHAMGTPEPINKEWDAQRSQSGFD